MRRPQPPNEHDQKHAKIEGVYIQVNQGEPILVARGETITLYPDDFLGLTQITYTAPLSLSVDDALAIEAYYQYDSCAQFHYLDGKFSTGVHLQGDSQPQLLNDPVLDNTKIVNPDWKAGLEAN